MAYIARTPQRIPERSLTPPEVEGHFDMPDITDPTELKNALYGIERETSYEEAHIYDALDGAMREINNAPLLANPYTAQLIRACLRLREKTVREIREQS